MEKIKKLLMTRDGRSFYIRSMSKDVHTQFGYIKAADIKKADVGDELVTNKGKKMFLLDAGFIDVYGKIKRGAQIVPRKDIGLILAETGVNKKSRVVDAGGGSGALTLMLANSVKEVVTYEIREDFYKIVDENVKFLGFKNVTLKNDDIYKGVAEKNVDLMTLDLPEPWLVIEHAAKALVPGGYLVSYSPSVPQMMDFVNEVLRNDNFLHVKSCEVMEREWEVHERKVRPKTQMIGHSGFLSFCRLIKR